MNRQQEQQKYFDEIAKMITDKKITLKQACYMIENLRDSGIFADVMDTEEEQQKGFNEIAAILADSKITSKQACELFEEWIAEWK